ncbi:MAG TPA: FKBP-type peptidyl-prolyl cis-trans isomerase [Kineosporiaceae bacterium]|nr:FKBP-type peptidyl-prolyl cis-trans isomerase [Kineosporiaceae bacterium]
MSPRFAIRRIGALLVAVTVVAGCSSAAGTDDSAAAKVTTDLSAVEVSGKAGVKPVMNVHAPFSATKTTRRLLTTGTGAVVAVGQRVTIDYLGVNGTDAKEFDASYGKDKATFNLDDGSIIKGMVEGLSGVKVGSRVLIAVPPKDGYGTAGQPDAGIGPTDTLLFVIDVKSASTVLKRAAGTAVKPKSGLPKVTLEKKTGKPTITLPKSKAPETLVVQPLINGTGAKVIKGQTITVHYTGVIWPGGKVFDSSWAKDTPATFPIGIGKVITGWDQGLVGKKVGSQILLVIPPDKGYGVAGKPEANIKGTDTLVFVVDILDAA